MTSLDTPMSESPVRLSPIHEQILAVALLPSDRALEHWERLGSALDVDQLSDHRAIKLLPLVWQALLRAGVDDPRLPSLEAIVTRTRASNELLFEQLRSAVVVLADAGVPSLALKGVPLAVLHYRDLGLRPMSDVDVLVELDDLPRAMAALDRAAWRAKELRADFVARSGATPYRSPDDGSTLDLHWRLEPWVARNGRDRDRDLWRGASPFDVRGQPLLAPAPHDLMLHVVLHAFRSDWSRITRWVPDVVILLRSSAAVFDWDALLDRVVRSHLVLPVRDALMYVSATFEAPVPPPVLAALRNSRTSRREAHKYRIASRSRPNRRRLVGDIPAMRIRWARVTINFTRVGALRALPAFLRGSTRVDRLSAWPGVVARRRLGRLHPRRRASIGD